MIQNELINKRTNENKTFPYFCLSNYTISWILIIILLLIIMKNNKEIVNN